MLVRLPCCDECLTLCVCVRSGVMNGSASAAHSESSGDVSVSLDSPQHSSLDGKRRAKSAGSEMVSLQQFLIESTDPAEVMHENPNHTRIPNAYKPQH